MSGSEWRLVGLRRFTQAIADDIDDGRSIIVGLPAVGVPVGLRAAVREHTPAIEVNHLMLGDLVDVGHTVLQMLFRRLDLDVPELDGERLHVGHLCEDPKLGRRLIWVDCRGASETELRAWARFLTQFSSAASGVHPGDRAVFGTLCTGRAMTILPASDRQIATHWWWGVVSPLDTASHVAEILGERPVLPTFAESVAEVAAFDLGLGRTLAEHWDGDPARLGEFLVEGPSKDVGWSEDPSPNNLPPPDSLGAWSAGMLNAWGEADPHPHAALRREDPVELATLVWRAQVGYLMPKIEVQRRALCRWLHEHRDLVAPSWAREDLLALEIGGVAKAFSQSPALARYADIADRAHWLRSTRNKIAHLEVLEVCELEQARRVFGGAARIPSRF